MGRVTFNGDAGTTYTNDTAKVQYQFLCQYSNSCATCIQYDHAIGPYWPIPYHRSCRCSQIPVPPGQSAQPFVDFIEKISELSPNQQAAVMGKANWQLVESGAVKFEDVVTPTRVRTLREVVSRNKLSVKDLTSSGVSPTTAAKAYEAVNTPAHVIVAQQRQALVDQLAAKGLSAAQIKQAAGERLAARVAIGQGPSGPSKPPIAPRTPKPILPQVAATLGIKPPTDPLAPFRDWQSATTLSDAKAWLKQNMGISRIVTSPLPNPGLEGTAFPDEAALLSHLNTIAGEWSRLRANYPNLSVSPVQNLLAYDGKRGWSVVPEKNPPSTSVSVLVKGQEWSAEDRAKIQAWEVAHGRTWTTERAGSQVVDNFRHEIGHALTTNDFLKGFVQATGEESADTMSLNWFKMNVSEYAATNVYEAIAESFSVYTRDDYKPGTLPPNLEGFFRDQLGK